MPGIAEVLLNLGYTVRGFFRYFADRDVLRLRGKGALIHTGHSVEHLFNGRMALTRRYKASDPELVAARQNRIPVVRRAEMLGQLMRLKHCVAIAGTHGKTTTTSLVAALLEAGKFDPTVMNG